MTNRTIGEHVLCRNESNETDTLNADYQNGMLIVAIRVTVSAASNCLCSLPL